MFESEGAGDNSPVNYFLIVMTTTYSYIHNYSIYKFTAVFAYHILFPNKAFNSCEIKVLLAIIFSFPFNLQILRWWRGPNDYFFNCYRVYV